MVWVGKRALYIFVFLYIYFVNEKSLRKKSAEEEIKSAGDFLNFAEEGKKCGSANDERREKLNRVWTRFVQVFDVKIIDEFLGVVEFIG